MTDLRELLREALNISSSSSIPWFISEAWKKWLEDVRSALEQEQESTTLPPMPNIGLGPQSSSFIRDWCDECVRRALSTIESKPMGWTNFETIAALKDGKTVKAWIWPNPQQDENGITCELAALHTAPPSAAALIADKDAEIASLKHCYQLLEEERHKQHERAEAAERALVEAKAQALIEAAEMCDGASYPAYKGRIGDGHGEAWHTACELQTKRLADELRRMASEHE